MFSKHTDTIFYIFLHCPISPLCRAVFFGGWGGFAVACIEKCMQLHKKEGHAMWKDKHTVVKLQASLKNIRENTSGWKMGYVLICLPCVACVCVFHTLDNCIRSYPCAILHSWLFHFFSLYSNASTIDNLYWESSEWVYDRCCFVNSPPPHFTVGFSDKAPHNEESMTFYDLDTEVYL